MKKLLIVVFATVFTVFGTTSAFAESEDMGENFDRANAVRAVCRAAQSTMQQISRSDAATRINRGRAYEKMLVLMRSYNARVALNGRNAPELAAITEQFQRETEAFRTSYNDYEDAMSRAVKVDCQQQPVTFYEALAEARSKREAVHQHIKTADALLNQYENAAKQVKPVAKGAN